MLDIAGTAGHFFYNTEEGEKVRNYVDLFTILPDSVDLKYVRVYADGALELRLYGVSAYFSNHFELGDFIQLFGVALNGYQYCYKNFVATENNNGE